MPRVLILDDDLASLAAARQAVRAAGHDAIGVTSAADARAALDAPAPPEVLLVAPGADAGEALALAVAANERGGHPLVMLLGAAGGAAASLRSLPVPLVPGLVAAGIAAGLAQGQRDGEQRTRPPSVATPSEGEAARPRLSPVRSASVAAEAALRALFRRPAGARAPQPSPPAKDIPREAPAPAPDAAPLALDIETLQGRVRTADYFEVLVLSRDATAHQVRTAASRLLNEVDAVRLSAEPSSLAAIEEIRQVIVDARDVLEPDDRRAQYLRGIAR